MKTQICFWYSPSLDQDFVFPRSNPNMREPHDWKKYKQSLFSLLPADTVYMGCSYSDRSIADEASFFSRLSAKILRIRMK